MVKISGAPLRKPVVIAHPSPTGHYRMRIFRTGYRHNDAYSAYIDMNLPKALSATQVTQLQVLTRDLEETNRAITVSHSGSFDLGIPMRTNDVLLVRLDPMPR